MNSKDFKKFCNCYFMSKGFMKVKNTYYCNGSAGVLCSIDLQKSNYGAIYYINYCFFLGTFTDVADFPSTYEFDIIGRIAVMSKTQHKDGKVFLTAQIEYEEYSQEELTPLFDKEFENKILPPIRLGKSYLVDNLNKLYFLTLRKEEVLNKLME